MYYCQKQKLTSCFFFFFEIKENGKDTSDLKSEMTERRAAIREALKQLVLWYAGETKRATNDDDKYGAENGVAPFAEISDDERKQLTEARKRLGEWASLRGDKDREFLQAEVAFLAQTKRAAKAAQIARKHSDDEAATLQRRCLRALGWHEWAEQLYIKQKLARPKYSSTIL